MTNISYRKKSIFFWILAFFLTIALAGYQRMTGPTYPVSGTVSIADTTVTYELIRSHGGEGDAQVAIPVPENKNIHGSFAFRRYKSYDAWDTIPMQNTGDTLIAFIPHQPPAGKVQYNILLHHNTKTVALKEKPVIIRFKGAVPASVLIPHILLMFLAMLFSMRTGFEALIKGKRTYLYTIITIITLTIGGLILGPVIQKYAFGQLWTGWPVSNDLTDNKTLIAFIFWIIAFIVQFRNRNRKGWALVASLILLIVYMIPHSVLGSEIDYRKQEEQRTEQTNE
ncbi:MAG: hypothetical protein K9I29_03850 [Bacteroidales bacterium]|nr:hypothetical protein [Bacteroidales bacterium]MCF8327406.1 hypothetical protein [Bacteroidales bacterium]